MAHNIGTEENPIPVFVRYSGGMIDAIVRCPSKEHFEQVATLVGLRYELTTTVTDPETGEQTEQGAGEFAYVPGVEVDHLGPVLLTPAVLDEEGNEITPARFDTRHHVNFRMAPPASERLDAHGKPRWWQWALAWTIQGANDETPNASEQAKILYDITLIDPDSIHTPSRVFL
jgi:hypothetical protein